MRLCSQGANDLLIAAAALHEKAILITHNADEFSRVKDLKIKDWVEESTTPTQASGHSAQRFALCVL